MNADQNMINVLPVYKNDNDLFLNCAYTGFDCTFFPHFKEILMDMSIWSFYVFGAKHYFFVIRFRSKLLAIHNMKSVFEYCSHFHKLLAVIQISKAY